MRPFDSIYSHDFVRVAVCIPHVQVADPVFNASRTIDLAQKASQQSAAIVLFPELGVSAYSNEDLFHQEALIDASLESLHSIVEASRDLFPVLLVGVPLRLEAKLFNCAVAIHRGNVLGVIPKTYLPNYREFYEKRQFTSGRDAVQRAIRLFGQDVPFGNDIVFVARDYEDLLIHAEICEDLWAPIPPSTYAALAGATVLCNLSASNITIGKADYRRDLCASQSGRCIAAYLYTAAGPGESTTDLAWDGHALVYENDQLLAESQRFSPTEQIVVADIDLERLVQERMRMTSFNDAIGAHRDAVSRIRRIEFELNPPDGSITLQREIERFPFVPNDPAVRDQRCFEAYNIQVQGLVKRLTATGISKIVIGVSGGLDSTQAIIVAARAMDSLGLARANILAYTMPGFATSDHTYKNAWDLMRSLGVTANEIDIKPSCMQMFADIGHPFAKGEPVYDITFENVQAGERTSHLFRLANMHSGIVLGTGDLSELALGWSTYGVGDHMSHYNVNTSVPKTLIQYLIDWAITSSQFVEQTSKVLRSILDTEISPELVPSTNGSSGLPTQRTQDKIGPYELQDFTLYYVTRHGLRPSKVAFLEWNAWSDRARGRWPVGVHESKRNQYDLATIRHWLEVFLTKFFATSQFKRSAVPNGPKVGSGGSLSPRGDWRAPSDSSATVWLEELRRNVPENDAGLSSSVANDKTKDRADHIGCR
ncbi:MAG: NAD(+) synthase [bacterium]|nr:NAD(+) synthase [Candidatus Kapabacteria bacterium]